MTKLRCIGIITAVLSSILIAAHFLRTNSVVLCVISLLVPLLFLIKSNWATRVIQGFLALAAVIWIHTMLNLISDRQAEQRPWIRMAIILSVVASVACLSAILLSIKTKVTHQSLPEK